jgi:hypothetical protein
MKWLDLNRRLAAKVNEGCCRSMFSKKNIFSSLEGTSVSPLNPDIELSRFINNSALPLIASLTLSSINAIN